MEFPSEEKERGYGWSISLVVLCDFIKGDVRPDANASEVRIFSALPDNMIIEQKEFLLKHWDRISNGVF